MTKVYAVLYDLNGILRSYSSLYEELKKSPKWMHYLNSAWLIQTDETSDQLWSRIAIHIDKNDQILIIEVRGNYQGWMPKEAWEWIHECVEKS